MRAYTSNHSTGPISILASNINLSCAWLNVGCGILYLRCHNRFISFNNTFASLSAACAVSSLYSEQTQHEGETHTIMDMRYIQGHAFSVAPNYK